MIRVQFLKSKDNIIGFEVSGHAGFADKGQDIVCAAVSSCVQMTINGITESAKVPADVRIAEDTVVFRLSHTQSNPLTEVLLDSFELQMNLLSQEYHENVVLTYSEV